MAGTEIDIEQRLDELGFIHMPVPNDGNCFYHSLITYLHMMQLPTARGKDIANLRHEITQFMKENIDSIVRQLEHKETNYGPIDHGLGELDYIKKGDRLLRALGTTPTAELPNALFAKFNTINSNKNGDHVNPAKKKARIIGLIDAYRTAAKKNIAELRSAFTTINANHETMAFDIKKKRARILRDIQYLEQDGKWASDLGDIIPDYAAAYLNITLDIYDWRWNHKGVRELSIKKINECDEVGAGAGAGAAAQPAGGAGAAAPLPCERDIIHLFRIDNSHYEVIFPKDKFKGLAKAIGGYELASMSLHNALRVYEELSPTSKFSKKFNEYHDNAEKGVGYIEEVMTTNVNSENGKRIAKLYSSAKEAVQSIDSIIASLPSAKSKGHASTRKKAKPKPKRASDEINIENELRKLNKKFTKLAIHTATKPSSTRRSARLAKGPPRPPTPPRPAARPNTKKDKFAVARNEESNTNSSNSVASVNSNSSGTRKKSTSSSPKRSSGTRKSHKPTIAEMREELIKNGLNIPKSATNEAITELYTAMHSTNSA